VVPNRIRRMLLPLLLLQDAEPTNPVDEVIQGRKRRKKPSDGDIDRDIENLVSQVSGAWNNTAMQLAQCNRATSFSPVCAGPGQQPPGGLVMCRTSRSAV
jgi:hypothetical protein